MLLILEPETPGAFIASIDCRKASSSATHDDMMVEVRPKRENSLYWSQGRSLEGVVYSNEVLLGIRVVDQAATSVKSSGPACCVDIDGKDLGSDERCQKPETSELSIS